MKIVPLYIARRLFASTSSDRASKPAVRVALAGIIVGMVVMICTICIVVGFKSTVTDKVAVFGAHLQVVNYDNNNTYEMLPITFPDSLAESVRQIDVVRQVRPFITYPGMLKTDDAFHAVVLKALPDFSSLTSSLVEGVFPAQDDEALLSSEQAQLLGLGVGDKVLAYFVDAEVRVRRFTISGLYYTGFSEYDNLFLWTTMSALRSICHYEPQECSGVEIVLDDADHMDAAAEQLYMRVANRFDDEGGSYYIQTLRHLNPQVFSWLDLLDMNVLVIIILMLCVSGFCIISGLIVLILEGVSTIGVLKSLGATDRFVRTVFLLQATMLVFRGVVIGDAIGLGLCAVQYYTHLIPLDAASYYVDAVPVAFPWLGLVALNVGTVVVSFVIMILPSAIINRISPARVMHFE